MSYLKFILIAALLALATAELNITLNADGTGFDATGLQKESVTRVINGHVARPGQIPWQATIFTLRQPQVWTFNSGALISRHFVVTLASSVRDSRETRVFLGSNQWGQGVQIFSTQTLFHPRSNTGNRLFDIAILRLNTPVTFSGLIRPIPLPADNLFNVRFDGQFVRLSGFGSMGRLSSLSILLISYVLFLALEELTYSLILIETFLFCLINRSSQTIPCTSMG